MAYWPNQLPQPALDGYSLAPQSCVSRTDMDAGPARQRRRFTQAPTDISLAFRMRTDQLEIFEAWFEHRIDSGAAWFDAPMQNGAGVTTVECRFVEPWQARPLGGDMHEVTCKWEARNRPVMTDAELTAAGVV